MGDDQACNRERSPNDLNGPIQLKSPGRYCVFYELKTLYSVVSSVSHFLLHSFPPHEEKLKLAVY